MKAAAHQRFRAIVIGGSSGGFLALQTILTDLPADFPLPLMVALHRASDSEGNLAALLNKLGRLPVKETNDKDALQPIQVYLAPSNYHLLVEKDHTLSLSIDNRVWFSRPAIDVLFESAADVFGPTLIGVLLTGANQDGAQGLLKIRQRGGWTIAQDPEDASMRTMPAAAIQLGAAIEILKLNQIGPTLMRLAPQAASLENNLFSETEL